MAQFHAHLKSISRADGRSATGAIAYRAACKIVDERTGLEFDFTKKQGVEHSQIFFPPGEENTRPDLHDRSNLWNAVEKKETKEELLMDIQNIFDYERIVVSNDELLKLSNGMTVLLNLFEYTMINKIDSVNQKLGVYSSNDEFIGIAKIIKFSESSVYIKRDKYFILNSNIST